MPVTMKVKNGSAKVTVKGECTVAQAAKLKDALVEAFQKARRITLDFTDVTATDMSVFQLICAAHRNAQSSGAEMELAAMPEHMIATIEEIGFDRHMPCSLDASGQCLFCLGERKKGN